MGCIAHRMHLAVKEYISYRGCDDVVVQVHKLMVSLCTLKGAAWLDKVCGKVAMKMNVTRWTSTHKMLQRYKEIVGAVVVNNDTPTLYKQLVATIDGNKVDDLLSFFEVIDKSFSALQETSCTLMRAKEICDLLSKNYPAMAHQLEKNFSGNGKSAKFMRAVAAIQSGDEKSLKKGEQDQVAGLKKNHDVKVFTNYEGGGGGGR